MHNLKSNLVPVGQAVDGDKLLVVRVQVLLRKLRLLDLTVFSEVEIEEGRGCWQRAQLQRLLASHLQPLLGLEIDLRVEQKRIRGEGVGQRFLG